MNNLCAKFGIALNEEHREGFLKGKNHKLTSNIYASKQKLFYSAKLSG